MLLILHKCVPKETRYDQTIIVFLLCRKDLILS